MSKFLPVAAEESFDGSDQSKVSAPALQLLCDLLGLDEGTRRIREVGRAPAQRGKSPRALCSTEGVQLLIDLDQSKVGASR